MSVTLLLGLLLVSALLPACVRLFYPPLPAGQPDQAVQAVVVLGGGLGRDADGWHLSQASLRRLHHAREQALQRGLPLLLSGGLAGEPPGSATEAELMAARLEGAGLAAVWQERKSHNTWSNARYSAEILHGRKVSRVLLVTDREHMTRAMLCFQELGLEVVPAPVDRLPTPDWAPSSAALAVLPAIWYEWAALIWYQLRY